MSKTGVKLCRVRSLKMSQKLRETDRSRRSRKRITNWRCKTWNRMSRSPCVRLPPSSPCLSHQPAILSTTRQKNKPTPNTMIMLSWGMGVTTMLTALSRPSTICTNRHCRAYKNWSVSTYLTVSRQVYLLPTGISLIRISRNRRLSSKIFKKTLRNKLIKRWIPSWRIHLLLYL